MKYYPISKKWSKIRKHLDNKEFNDILVRDFNKFTYGRWKKPFKHGMYPFDFESCDWHCDRKGRRPEFWKYVKHAACYWLVNANLKLAMLTEPGKDWQIVVSNNHATVWDGDETLFDMNFTALAVDPDECFELAYTNGELIEIGKPMKVYFAEHYSVDQKRRSNG
jgi:hypothetical protein